MEIVETVYFVDHVPHIRKYERSGSCKNCAFDRDAKACATSPACTISGVDGNRKFYIWIKQS